MRVSTSVLVSIVVLAAQSAGPAIAGAAAQEAVFLVRHAERLDDAPDSALSSEGWARAARLADQLRDARITDIVVTQYQRTAETAAPLAGRLGVTPQRVSASETAGLVARIRALGPKARVLVVGHSDTVPEILKALGYQTDVTIARSEYDNLFVLMPGDKTGPVVLRLRY